MPRPDVTAPAPRPGGPAAPSPKNLQDPPRTPVRRFFGDETGDTTLFGRGNRWKVGRDNVTAFLGLGVVELGDPDATRETLRELRRDLVNDPFLKDQPSIRDPKKTAGLFHACNDLPEVRQAVFRAVLAMDVRAYVVFRRKAVLAADAWERPNVLPSGRRKPRKLNERDTYREMFSHLFRDLLHEADRNEIVLAKRGKTYTQKAVAGALQEAKRQHGNIYGSARDRPCRVTLDTPDKHPGLQVTDYLLWAFQRLLEKGDARHFTPLRAKFRLIIDLDDPSAPGGWRYGPDADFRPPNKEGPPASYSEDPPRTGMPHQRHEADVRSPPGPVEV